MKEQLEIQARNVINELYEKAKLKKGDIVGEYRYILDEMMLGSVEIACLDNVKKITFGYCISMCEKLFFGNNAQE